VTATRKPWKLPVSVLVVIWAKSSGKVLLLQRNDDAEFWQSVTGSLEAGELPIQAARREVFEETGFDWQQSEIELIDCQHQIIYDIFPHYLHRYAPGITQNLEHWFVLLVPDELPVSLTEHSAARWLPWQEACVMTKSWSNRQAIEYLANGRFSRVTK
jgi:dihydroneopterin triphosphate diphosphatase